MNTEWKGATGKAEVSSGGDVFCFFSPSGVWSPDLSPCSPDPSLSHPPHSLIGWMREIIEPREDGC